MDHSVDSSAPNAEFTEYECGCYEEYGYNELGQLELHRASLCVQHSAEHHEWIRKLAIDSRAQLTIDLPSAKGDRRR